MKNTIIFLFVLANFFSQAQVQKAPEKKEGEGPYTQLIIRGVTVIDGTGAPAYGPVDIVIEKNKIKSVEIVGTPGAPINISRRPVLLTGGKELNADGMYLLPGFIDMHAHIGDLRQNVPAEYTFKLWMGHGITTIRDPNCRNGLDWVLDQKKKSEQNLITAPRIKAYTSFGQGVREGITSPEQAIVWVRENAKKGADGIKFGVPEPSIMKAALAENKKLGLRSACHHSQIYVARWNALHSARSGLTTLEHWYGLPEALLEERTVQDYPAEYNYANEQHRFEEAGKLWKQAAKSGSDHWNKVMKELIALDFTLVPTFSIYEANRDLMRARRAEWHEEYTMPSLWKYFEPSREAHGSYWHSWGTEQEISWKENYRLWMQFINEYKNRGGRVAIGTDAGFIYQTYGFSYPREMELFREAGFHPLEVIRSATLYAAQALGMQNEIGSVEVGKLADFVIVDANPLANFQVLYGTGAIHLNEKNEVVRKGGVVYTIKDGIIYDAKKLLTDVKKMVAAEKAKTGFQIVQPGVK